MSDEKFEEFLRREAQGYNPPPAEVPRDAMWGEIAKARAAQRIAAAAPARGFSLRKSAPWIGMAATLLLGIGIGRYVMREPGTPEPAVMASTSTSGREPEPVEVDTTVSQPTQQVVVAAAPSRERGDPATVRTAATPRLPVETPIPRSNQPYDLASRRHLERAEALVTLIASPSADPLTDSLTARWAREMLTNTRLLLDSPAGEDQTRRRLLQDLETVLVQLVQRSGAEAEERALIDRTLERTKLLTRLRTGAAGI